MSAGRIGAGHDRVDAAAKVTGGARFAGDIWLEGMLHAALVPSTVCGGRVRRIDASAAAALPGVVGVMTHADAPRLEGLDRAGLLQDATIRHGGQPVAVVVATSLAQARAAAALVQIEYDDAPARPPDEFAAGVESAFAPADVFGEAPASVRGDPDAALARADLVRVDAVYTTPTHVHSPIEPHAAIARWDGDRVTVDTSTSGIFAARAVIARAFGLPAAQVRVLCRFQGGGFCSKGSAWWPCLLVAVSAAKLYGRPVRLVLAREQMFAVVGNRQRTRQRMSLAADRDRHLVAMSHEVVSETGLVRDYSEMTCIATRTVYRCPNVAVRHRLVRTHMPQPLPMRGPGEGPGSFALESALDELAAELGLDPVELRLRNWAERDQHADRPWSSNSLRECLLAGGEAFGWRSRGAPGSVREGALRIGRGVASSYYPGFRATAAARVRLGADGAILLDCGNQEIGTGAATIMAQAAAEVLRAPAAAVEVRWGDTELPETPMAAGAMATASVVPAVETAARALRQAVVTAVTGAGHPPPPGADLTSAASLAAILTAAGVPFAEAEARTDAAALAHSVCTFGACYAEVSVDPELGQVRVRRLVGAYAAGRIMNAKLARSQLVGGLVFGIGMALHEKVEVDPGSGLVAAGTLCDYLVPVHADVPDIEVLLVPEHDPHVPSGVKGLGMNGTVGAAAAIASAVHHAIGVRVRDLPIRPDALVSPGIQAPTRAG